MSWNAIWTVSPDPVFQLVAAKGLLCIITQRGALLVASGASPAASHTLVSTRSTRPRVSPGGDRQPAHALMGVGAGPVRVAGVEGPDESFQGISTPSHLGGEVEGFERLDGEVRKGEPAPGRFGGETLSQRGWGAQRSRGSRQSKNGPGSRTMTEQGSQLINRGPLAAQQWVVKPGAPQLAVPWACHNRWHGAVRGGKGRTTEKAALPGLSSFSPACA
jgi:hypothetical protein